MGRLDLETDKVINQIKDAGEAGVFPFTFNHDLSLACVCLGQQRIRAGTQKIAAAADQSHRGPARSH